MLALNGHLARRWCFTNNSVCFNEQKTSIGRCSEKYIYTLKILKIGGFPQLVSSFGVLEEA